MPLLARQPKEFPAVDLATREDVPGIVRVHLASNRLFAGTGLLPEHELRKHVPEENLRQAIAHGLLFVVRDADSRPIGFAMARHLGETLYLDQVSVDPDHGRRGIGRRLIFRIIEAAEHRGARTVTLSTFRELSWNGPFYRRLGFRELARRKLTEWMLDIEAAQATTMDVSLRCFMYRRVRGSLFRPKPSAA